MCTLPGSLREKHKIRGEEEEKEEEEEEDEEEEEEEEETTEPYRSEAAWVESACLNNLWTANHMSTGRSA